MKTNNIITTTLAAAILLTLGSGCARINQGGGFSTVPLSFRSYTTRPLVKSDPTILGPGELPDGSRFGVFAFYQQGVVGSSTAHWGNGGARSSWSPNFMFNQAVDFDGSDYDYSPLRYWPSNEENTISFWAYYPYSLYSAGNTGALKFYSSDGTTPYTAASTGLPVVKYTVPQDPAQQVDILFDSFANVDKTYGNCLEPGVVPITLRHALCLVEFRLREGTGATINSMSLTGLKWSGTCTDPGARSWTDQTDASPIEYHDLSLDGTLIMRMLMMPQSLAGVELSINYDIVFESSAPSVYPDPIVYSGNVGSAALTTSGITSLVAGQHYIFTINAGFERIEFEEAVADGEDWTSAGADIELH